MYNFIDTTEVLESVPLPSEALKINGEYIENLIPGYRTLHVSGREALSPELDHYETGVRDGSKRKSKRFPARSIFVTYQLIAESNEAFREAYNALGKILNVEDAELIFDDEPDKFFIGTPLTIGEVEPGKNAVVGEIEFFCADPFKYSVIEYEAEPEEGADYILIDYKGTYKSFPTLEADFYSEKDVEEDGETAGTLTGNGDCGYVAFFNEDEKIVQIGDVDEIDGSDDFEKSQTLTNQLFTGESAWGDKAKSLWAVNSASGLPMAPTQAGDVQMGIASYTEPETPAETSGTLLKATVSTVQPTFNYTVTAKATNRTETTVKVAVAITASLGYDSSYFGNGYGLKGHLYIGGAWHEVVLKTASDYWKGKTGHTVNLSVDITGLSGTTAALTGIKFKTTRTDSYGTGKAGVLAETACSNLAISKYVADVPDTYYLTPKGYGTASGKWHGPTITRTITADASGVVGATDFTFTFGHKITIGEGGSGKSQVGAFQAQLVDSDGNNVAGIRIHKNKTTGTMARILFYVNGVNVFETAIDVSFKSAVSKERTATITKSGEKIVFKYGSVGKTITDSTVKDTAVSKITFSFEQYSNNTPLAFNGLYWAKFVKNNCDTWNDIPNKFSADDVVEADCNSGEILLNGNPAPELGALGNDWEGFALKPGLNQIGFAFSDWVAEGYEPTFKIRYREVFL